MKLLNFIFSVLFITTSIFFYTYQKVEAIKCSYDIKAKKITLDKLLDRKRELEYNVAKLKAPTYLELQLAKSDIKMVLPERWQVFEATGLKSNDRRPTVPLFVRNIVGLFALRSEAQATPAKDTLATEKPY